MTTPLSNKSEAKRLHDMGFGVHWIKPNSKVPVKAGWTDNKRDSIATLHKEHQKGYNIGTKLGEPSNIGFEKYLAVIDVDIKGTEKKHVNSALAWLNKNLPGIMDDAPITLSGRGNGSMHIWIAVDRPVESKALTQSSEEVEVYMPSAKPTARQAEILGKKKIKEGMRLRPAWEIDFMCAGRQVVLPPSIHPDSGKQYKWKRPIKSVDDIPYIDVESLFEVIPENKKSFKGRPSGSPNKTHFEIVDPEEYELDTRLDGRICSAIYDGDDVPDRSAMMLTIALSMVRAKFTDAEILGVLTNRKYYIGDCAFEHAKTTNRQRAARWANDYCLRKARSEADASVVFDCEVVVYDTLTEKQKKNQTKRLVNEVIVDWKKLLDRTDKGNLKPTFKNTKLILENVVGENLFVHDEFSIRDYYGINTPWGRKAGDELTDADEVFIKSWFASNWHIEPTTGVIFEVIVKMSKDNGHHPVRSYLESLEWDGVPRIDNWLKTYLGAEGEELYLKEVSRKFLVAAVARIFQPGVKFDCMLILEGLQGIGKSSVGYILAGQQWFLDSLPDLHDKDSALNLQGNWLVEMGELANLKRTDVETVKSFISRQVDKVRPPYGKRYIMSNRQCVFFGTTNSEDYLKDKTGNRRFWPVKVHELDREALTEDRDQLWAEAMFVYDNVGENLWLEGEAKDQAEAVQESRVADDTASVIADKIYNWYEAVKRARAKREEETGKIVKPMKLKIFELFDDFVVGDMGSAPLGDFKQDNYTLQLAATGLRGVGFEKIKVHGYVYWKEKRQDVIEY